MIRIRPRRAADLPDCVRALWPVHVGDGYPIHWPDDPAAWIDPRGLAAAWVAEVGEQLVGHVGVMELVDPFDIPCGAAALVTRLFVAPSSRGRGVAVGLLDAVRTWARASGRTVLLEVIDGTPAVGAYEHLGWRLQDIRTSDWAARDGRHRTVRIYAAPLLHG